MTIHKIILSSSYSTGKRIVLHFTDGRDEDYRNAVRSVSNAFDGKQVQFSQHSIQTDDPGWESVVKKDPYFDDVEVVSDVGEFVKLIAEDRYLKGMDVARYILSNTRCTHVRLEKLTYMCYADYLCATGSRLFTDDIYAFQYGPVVGSVYETYRDFSPAHPMKYVPDDTEEIKWDRPKLPYRGRIVFSEDGISKMASIDRTLKRLEDVSGTELVQMTHREGAPWSMVPHDRMYAVIPDDLILHYHHIEYEPKMRRSAS